MSLAWPNRPQIEALPGGRFLADALDAIADALGNPLRISGTTITAGTGTPEGVVVGNIGDLFLRTDGSTTTTLYVKTSGTNSNTGWTAK